jgi:hypothetical protein
MSSEMERLYCLKGRIGIVGNDTTCRLSFVLPWFDRGELAYFNITFTDKEFMLNDPEQFIEVLKLKIENLKESWNEHVRDVDKGSPT